MNEPVEGTRGQSPDEVRRLTPPVRPPSAPFAKGDPVPGLSSWVLQRKLGAGGFGEVWLARHAWDAAQPPRAVKFCTDPETRHRLVTHERNVVVRVMTHAGRHPNIVPLLDCNLGGDIPWLMYEFVEGDTLAGVIERSRAVPPPARLGTAVRTLRAIAGALAACHRLDPPLVHRDLKPQNVLMAGSVPRVSDFGIGGVVVPQGDTAAAAHTARAARVPSALHSVGTRAYAPPEQMLGSPPHPRDDVYALGVIAYQMVVGDPLVGPGADATLELLDLQVPGELAALIVRSVAINPDRRPRDATEWEAVLAALPQAAPPLSDSAAPASGSRAVPPPFPLTITEGPSVRTEPAPAPPAAPPTAVEPHRPDRARYWALTSLAVLALAGAAGGLVAVTTALGNRGPAPAPAPEVAEKPQPTAPQPTAPQPKEPQPKEPSPKESAPVPLPQAPPPTTVNQTSTGNGGVIIGTNPGTVIVNPKPTPVKITVLNNGGDTTLVLKEIKNKDNPLFDALEVSNQLGTVPVGTEVKVVEATAEIRTPNPAIRFRQVEILDGDLKGKIGWVLSNTIRLAEVLR